MANSKRNTKWARRLRYGLVLKGMAAGAAAGLAVSLFRFALTQAEPLRAAILRYAERGLAESFCAAMLLLLAFAGTCLCLRFAPMCGGSGIPQLKGELMGEREENWWKTLTAKIAGGCLCIGAGLALGAVFSGAFAQIMTGCGLPSIYIGTFAMMGMTGLFAAIVRSPLTGIILITEMGGDYANFLALSLVAFAAYVVADLLHSEPIYDQLLARMLDGPKTAPEEPEKR